MRTLVTGGAGFIGSHLCEQLLEQGDEVLCIDNFVTGTPGNVASLSAHRGFECVYHDVVEPIAFEVDRVFVLACPASPVQYQVDPIKTVKTSVLGILHALELAGRVGARLLLASTSEVYGDPQQHPQSETYWGHVNPIGPRSCYDEGKRIAETLCFDHHRQDGVDIRVARIFNTYGPRMAVDDGRVVSNFAVQALQNRDITLHGDGAQTRSFCYVDDLVCGMLRMMSQEATAGPVNLGNPCEISIRDLAELIIDITGSRSQTVYRPLPVDDPVRRCPDITRAKQLLGWHPTVDLRNGLTQTIAYLERTLAANGSATTNSQRAAQ